MTAQPPIMSLQQPLANGAALCKAHVNVTSRYCAAKATLNGLSPWDVPEVIVNACILAVVVATAKHNTVRCIANEMGSVVSKVCIAPLAKLTMPVGHGHIFATCKRPEDRVKVDMGNRLRKSLNRVLGTFLNGHKAISDLYIGLVSSTPKGKLHAPVRVEDFVEWLVNIGVHDLGGMQACPYMLAGHDVISGKELPPDVMCKLPIPHARDHIENLLRVNILL